MTLRVWLVAAILLSLIGAIGCDSSTSSAPSPAATTTKDSKPAPKGPARTPKS